MRTWLKRMVAGIVSAGTLMGGGLLMAGTANADEIRMPDIGKTITSLTASAATTYPRELVNGGFDYLPAGGWNVISPKLNTSRGKFTSVDPVNGQYIRNAYVTDGNVAWVKWDGFDASKFGWISDQKGGKPQGFVTDHANSVELQRDNDTDNTYAEIVGSEIDKSIYQKIDTQNSTDAVYTVRFDHAALSSEHADGMQALVNGKPVTMTRIGGNKAGDKTGWTGTDIVTHATNTDHYRHDGQWATYEGKVTIPANTPVSTFTFKSLNEAKPDMGNLIDNLTFKIAYRLSYDSNGGTKAKASQISSMTEGKASETDGKVKTVADDAAGSIPSNETAGAVKQAKSKTNGSVRLAADDDVAEYAVNGLPDHLVNGDFEYPVKSDMPANDGKFWYISQNDGSYFANGTVKRYKLPEGFDKAKFAWHSTQTGDTSYPDLERADDVQVDYKADGTNHYSEISATQSGATIYQDVATVPGVMYKWSLKHASLDSSHLDKMSVIIGEPGKETAQEATRTTANGHGDKLGKVGTVISTKVSNPEMRDGNKFQEGAHTGQWETYTGTYIATGTVTRFAFHSVEGYSAWDGNLLDDISFSKAYKLTYDKNASDATGSVPSDTTANTVNQAKADATGTVKTVTDTKTKTSGTVKTVADTNASLPDHLVNGDFSVNYKDQWLTGGWNWTSITPDGKYLNSVRNWNDSATIWKTVNGWDKTKFGWSSTQKDGTDNIQHKAGATEIQYDDQADNVYAELCAYEKGTAIYQDIKTVPGVLYKIRLKHASLYSGYLDKMQVLIGAPGHETPVEMTRTSVNGHGDKLNEKSTVIATKVTNGNNRHHESQWETYEGTYLIPDGQTTTRFTFKSIDAKQLDRGNVLDDIVFDKAYRLSYDKNASDATGKVPSNQRGKENAVEPAESKTTGNVKTVADNTSNLPDHLVNGTFDYRGNEIINENQRVYGDTTYLAIISAKTGVIGNPLHSKLNNWDSGKFGWKSNDATAGVDTVEVQRRNHTPYPTNAGNVWGEIAAAKRGRYIYQDIATTPGIMYKWSLKHASRNADQDDSMQVMIGEPGKTVAQQATRTTSNGSDKTGSVGTTITTHGTAQDGKWETYTGTYIATSTVTRFTFRSVRDSNGQGLDFTAEGNCVDDLSFDKAYRLGYDANGGDKTDTSQIKASSDGTVKSIADKTSKVPVHDLEDTDVPGQYRDFILDTTKVKFSDVKFENGAWLNAPMPDSGDGATAMFPLKIGASATLPNVGEWTDGSGHTHSINAIISLHSWNGGSISRLWTQLDGQPSTSRDLFWINTVGRNSDLPAQVIKALGGIDTSKRVGCQWTVNFTYEDGTPVPDTFRGVTGFNDLDGWDVQPDLKFEGVQLVSGFDGAYKTRDAELATYGINGFAGVKHDSGPESNLDGKQQVKHRLAATWTGSSFTFGYDLQNPEGRDRGCRMTFGVPVTRTQVLTYKANGGTGQVPSHTEAGKVESASVKTAGSVHAISDATDTTGSAEGKAVSGVLTGTTVDAGDGTRQRTITRSDGSVRVETIATTGAVSGCQVYYPAGTRITLATAKMDSDCWDSSQISKTNRTFYGWSANTDANDRDVPVADTMDRNTLNANVRTEIVMPARAKTVYALWAINPTLTYNVNAPATTKAPDAPASITVPYNTAADDKSGWTVGDTGKITGYSFDGWYTSPTGGDKYDWSTKLTNDVTMYAHWTANGYTVKYDAGGGKGTMGDQKFTFDVPQNLSPNAFTRDGYTFTGWKRADTGDAYQDGQQVANLTSTPNGIVTMIAQWTPNPASINYDPNPPTGRTPGGQGTANWTGHTGDTQAIGANGWTVDGYTFIGWNTSADGKGTAYAPGTTWTANGTLTLYAQWTPGQASLTYDGNGATGGKTDPQTGKTDEKINVRDNGFTRDGYMFVTWNTQAGCKGKAVNPGDEWTLQGSSTLYACWAGTAQTLAYHGNGATGGNTAVQSGKTGDELTTNANGFTRDGYTFVRWDTAKDGSGTAYGEGKNGVSQYVMKPAGNDLYAIWKANPASIQYRDDYGATGSTPDTTGVTGQNVTIAQNGFTRPGYTFTGWARDRRTDPSLQPGGRYTLTPGTTTLWAQWKADPAHLIYNSNSGSTSQTRRTDGVVDQTLTVIANPFTRSGYTFTGWNTQADGRGKAYAAGNGFRLVADAKSNPVNTSVLYAQWRINRVALKFDPNGGTGGYPDITVDAFTTVTIPADAKEPKVQRPGFRFTGWAMKPAPGAGDTILGPGKGTVTMPDQGSITVYAQWEPSLTTLPFTGGQAQVPTIWLYAGFALMLIALGVMMPMLRMRMAATKRTGKHMPITGGKHAK